MHRKNRLLFEGIVNRDLNQVRSALRSGANTNSKIFLGEAGISCVKPMVFAIHMLREKMTDDSFTILGLCMKHWTMDYRSLGTSYCHGVHTIGVEELFSPSVVQNKKITDYIKRHLPERVLKKALENQRQ